jgi:hypothetical protein
MTDHYDAYYDLGIEEGMTPEEAHLWAEGQVPRARARSGGGVSGVLESLGLPEHSNTPETPGGPKTGPDVFGIYNLAETMARAQDRPEPKMIVDGLLPQGLTILAGGSKLGKSFMSLDIAFGVAAGAPVLGSMVTEQGQVLYLALEDRDDRLFRRMAELEPDKSAWPDPTDLCLVAVNTLGDYQPGALAIAWAEQATNPRLVIIDTITRFGGQSERSGYREDVTWMTKFHKYAQQHDIAVIGVTHTRQMKLEEGEDWFNKITGTSGIVGTADQAMLLDVQRGENEGMLRVTGRDLPDAEFALRRTGGFWSVTDQLRGKRGDLSVAIGDYVIQAGETTTAQVAEHFDMSSARASQYLGRLRRNGVISQVKRATWSGTRVDA